MKSEFMTKVSRSFNRAGLQLKKHSPEILMGVGIVGTVASTVLACKATMKIDEVLEEPKRKIDIIHQAMEDGEVNGVEYTKEDGTKDLTIMYTQTGVKLLKLYAPAIALGTFSIGCMVAGHKILKGRNIALAAAYAVVDKGFKDYRKNVVSRFGESVDKELRYNIKAVEVEEIVTDEKGKEKVEKKIIDTIENPNEISEYARFFDETCAYYEKDAEYNMMFLRQQQQFANDRLKANGHLFLNEVYDALGMKRTRTGQIVGWVYDKHNPNGDNFVDFGIYNGSERSRAFVNGHEKAILLDFNVDGPIYDMI